MRKLAEKIALIAQICITLVFAVITLLNITNIFGNYGNYDYNEAVQQNDGVLTALVFVLFLAYVGLSAYMLYVNFSERENLKRVLLFCDSESATHTTAKVVRKIVADCSRQTEGITVKKARIRADEKQGLAITLKVTVNADNVSQVIDKFRCLIADSFKNTLGIAFNSVNFEVTKLTTRYTPRLDKANELAEKLGDQREIVEEIYNEPLENDVNVDNALNKDKDTQDAQ